MRLCDILLQVFLAGCLCSQLNSQPAWHLQNAPISEDLISVSFADTLYGWAASANGTVIRTSDGGSLWEVVAHPEGFYPNKIFFQDRNTGWMTGSSTSYVDTAFISRPRTEEKAGSAITPGQPQS